jgi:hypothetical protein
MATGNEIRMEAHIAYKTKMERYVMWGKLAGIASLILSSLALILSVSYSYGVIGSADRNWYIISTWMYLLGLASSLFWYRTYRAFVSDKANYINTLQSPDQVQNDPLLRSVWVSSTILAVTAGFFVLSLALSGALGPAVRLRKEGFSETGGGIPKRG